MALRRKQEEKNLAQLRELAALAHNKQCLDCGQRGPTYVNMTIGSFVCTSCSGRLRGLTPPHRVKSISMASFTGEEIELIKQRGNQWCKAVWLGLYDPSRHPEIDTKDDQQIKDFMIVKYEKKRYYVEPSVALAHEQSRSSAASSTSCTPAASVAGTQPTAAAAEPLPAVKPLSKLTGAPVKPISLAQNVSLPGPTRPAERNNIDLLSELSPSTAAAQADPFSPSGGAAPAGQSTNANANFANFANFEALSAAIPAAGGSGAGFPSAAAPAPVPATAGAAATSGAAPVAVAGGSGDRYAALKELDDVLRAEVEPKVDWGAAHRESAPPAAAWNAFGTASNGSSAFGAAPNGPNGPGTFATNGPSGFSSAQNGPGGFSSVQNGPGAGSFGSAQNGPGAGSFGSAQNGPGARAFGATANGPGGGVFAANGLGASAYAVPQRPAYGSSPQQQLYGGSPHQGALFTSPQQQPATVAGFPTHPHFPAANGYSPESSSNGAGRSAGAWSQAPGAGAAAWSSPSGAGAAWSSPAGSGAGWPTANPFTQPSQPGAQPANPHNPFL